MNSWVFAGFDETYKRLGINFDHTYLESNTYLLGKDIIADGLAKGKARVIEILDKITNGGGFPSDDSCLSLHH